MPPPPPPFTVSLTVKRPFFYDSRGGGLFLPQTQQGHQTHSVFTLVMIYDNNNISEEEK